MSTNTAATKPAKLHIVAYEDPEFTKAVAGGEYWVQVNPDKYSKTYKIDYNTEGADGSSNTPPRFTRMPPPEMKFELLFDATGAIDGLPPGPAPDFTPDLAAEIKAFQKVVYCYDGAIHEPRYLKLHWGSLVFGARLTALTLNYTLFSPTGQPLRARANVSFVGFEDAGTTAKAADDQSPDITHLIVTQAGDTLPLLSYRVYGDTGHYRDLARHNGLVSFRHLPAGLTLVLPPLD